MLTSTEIEQFGVNVQRKETHSVCQYFVLHYGRVVEEIDVFDGHRWHLGDHNATECIRNRGVNTDEVKGNCAGGKESNS